MKLCKTCQTASSLSNKQLKALSHRNFFRELMANYEICFMFKLLIRYNLITFLDLQCVHA